MYLSHLCCCRAVFDDGVSLCPRHVVVLMNGRLVCDEREARDGEAEDDESRERKKEEIRT